MSSSAVGLCFCLVFSVASAVSVGIPYWYYMTFMGLTQYSGLWQKCYSSVLGIDACVFSSFGDYVWYDAARGLEVVGVIFGLIGSFIGTIAVCGKKTRGMYVAAGLSALFGAGCIGSGFIIIVTKSLNPFENTHAGFYLNIIGCIGLGLGGLLLLCTRNTDEQYGNRSGQVLQTYGQQPVHTSDVNLAMHRRY